MSAVKRSLGPDVPERTIDTEVVETKSLDVQFSVSVCTLPWGVTACVTVTTAVARAMPVLGLRFASLSRVTEPAGELAVASPAKEGPLTLQAFTLQPFGHTIVV